MRVIDGAGGELVNGKPAVMGDLTELCAELPLALTSWRQEPRQCRSVRPSGVTSAGQMPGSLAGPPAIQMMTTWSRSPRRPAP
jgi:hypothetical protein